MRKITGACLVILTLFTGTSVAFSADIVEIGIIHWNDFHAYDLPQVTDSGDSIGGYAMLEAYRDSLVALHPGHSFVLHAGDDFQGTPISTLTKGASQIKILNRVRPDAFVLGNHEFDYGWHNLDSLVQTADFPVLSANIIDEQTGQPVEKPTVILRKNGVSIGVIGITTPELYTLTLPANVARLKILPAAPVVKKYARALEPHVDLTVVLSHMGVHLDSLLAVNLGPNSPVDLIVGGHSHTALFQSKRVDNIYIVQAGAHGEYVGYFQAAVDTLRNAIVSVNYQLIPIKYDGRQPDQSLAAYIGTLEDKASSKLNQVIGYLKIPWKRQYNAESNIGDWQTDVMRRYANAEVAFQNSGGIRKDLPAGPIRLRDLWEMNPFSNHFVTSQVDGETLKQIARHQIENPQEFLQISGLKYTWDKSEQQFTRLLVNDQPINKKFTYTLVTNNYVFSHFRDFFGAPESTATNIHHLPKIDRDVFVKAVQRQDTVKTTLQHRAQIVE